jgi:hypothetical protein
MLAKHEGTPPAHFALFILEMGVSGTIEGLDQCVIAASQVVGIIGMKH